MSNYFQRLVKMYYLSLNFLTHIQGGSFQGYSRMRDPSIKILKPDETWYSYTLPNKGQMTNPRVLLTLAYFHWKSSNFPISRNTYIDCNLTPNF